MIEVPVTTGYCETVAGYNHYEDLVGIPKSGKLGRLEKAGKGWKRLEKVGGFTAKWVIIIDY